MPLIDISYFDGRLAITDVNNDAVTMAVNAAIEYYEPVYLQAALGPSLYEAFRAGLASPAGVFFSGQFSDQFFHGTIADRWKWIRDGHSFTYGGRMYVWPGMQNVRHQSPIANYVFSFYRGENLTVRTTNGDQVPTGQNMATVSGVDRRIVTAWNDMVDWNRILLLMIRTLTDDDNAPLYPEFVWGELCADKSVDIYNSVNTLNI